MQEKWWLRRVNDFEDELMMRKKRTKKKIEVDDEAVQLVECWPQKKSCDRLQNLKNNKIMVRVRPWL